ncbi:hypothetical protein Tco_0119579, partial [Tanacetum coccineum]
EKVIKEINEQAADASKKRVKKDDSIKGEIKEEEGTRKRKLGIRKKLKSKKRKFTSKDDEELRLCNRQRRYFSTLMAGDLIIIFNQSGNDEFWNAHQNWKIVSWKLHGSSGIHTIMNDEGIVIHMLVSNKYPLLKLETEEDSTMALELIRFVKKQIAELEPEDSDGDEKDL